MAKLAVCVSVLLVLLLVALSESSPRKYCCTRYQENPVSVQRLKSYTVQDDNCKLRAIIFKTVKNRHLCANPEDEWVKKLMESVPRKS